MPGSDGVGILVIFEKSSSLRSDAGRGQSSCVLRDAPRVVGSDGTVSIVTIVYLSLSSCRKSKSQEGNRSFVPEQPRVVSVSGFLCMWTFYISVYFMYSYISHIHIWLCCSYRNKCLIKIEAICMKLKVENTKGTLFAHGPRSLSLRSDSHLWGIYQWLGHIEMTGHKRLPRKRLHSQL